VKPRRRAGGPVVPDWARHEYAGGFVVSDWAAPSDFALDPAAATSAARARWFAARNEFLLRHGDVADALLDELRALARDVDS
jgi:hypothetical protein